MYGGPQGTYCKLKIITIRTNFVKCFAVRAVGSTLQPQCLSSMWCGQQLNLSQVSNKAASSVDKEKLFEGCIYRGILTQPSLVCWKNVVEYECT